MQTDVLEGFRLSPQQEHLWSLLQADRSQPYHAQCAISIEGSLDTEILKVALQKLFERHEILRTSFRYGRGTTVPLQIVDPKAILVIDDHDLSDCDLSRENDAIEELYRQAGGLIFDVESSAVVRMSLLTLSPDRHLLLINLSTLCADSASLDNLVREISRCYAFCVLREEISDEPVQYADAAEWQNSLLESDDTEEGRKYWRERRVSSSNCPRLSFQRRPLEGSAFDPQILRSSIKPETAAKSRGSFESMIARRPRSSSPAGRPFFGGLQASRSW